MDFPPSKLKAGYGEQACYVLDCLADEALKYSGFSWKRYSNFKNPPLCIIFQGPNVSSCKGWHRKCNIDQKSST